MSEKISASHETPPAEAETTAQGQKARYAALIWQIAGRINTQEKYSNRANGDHDFLNRVVATLNEFVDTVILSEKGTKALNASGGSSLNSSSSSSESETLKPEEEVYHVEANIGFECNQCHSGRIFHVIDPNGYAIGTSYINLEDAEDMARDLSFAYEKGRASCTPKEDSLVPCEYHWWPGDVHGARDKCPKCGWTLQYYGDGFGGVNKGSWVAKESPSGTPKEEAARLKEALGSDLAGRTLPELLTVCADKFHEQGSGPLVDCLRAKAEQIEAALRASLTKEEGK